VVQLQFFTCDIKNGSGRAFRVLFEEESRDVPGFSTARHSSLDRWSGYVIFSDAAADVPKKELRNGIEGIDLRRMAVR